ncbi:hypothetical protein Clacol_004997 [Clathrus columnatus]|uniref:Uncharacterized protein n=1 Tax=Clathrus columnatus TaxID=1419009 RepID=A0AAV5A825_9AGAM|nr:hypothetical protein Clacol_004997 [Clathrus columnatus]
MLEIFRYECQRRSFRRLKSSVAQGSIPENLFADYAPKLKEFYISRVKLYHDLPIFKTITRLSLKQCHGLTRCRLLDILETTSLNLEVLEISSPTNFIWPSDASGPDNRPTILLSSLRTLVLNVRIRVLLLVLNCTNIPRDIDWRINFDELIVNVSLDLTPFVSFLTKVRKGPYVFFTIYEEYLCIKFKQTRSGPYNTVFELEIDTDSEDEALRRLETIWDCLELSKVLSFELVYPMKYPPWMKMYDHMFQPLFFLLDRTETLSIICNTGNNQLEAFVGCLRPRNAQSTITIPCPSLKDLKVGILTTGGFLIQGLAARKEAGHVLTKLCVEYENESYMTIKQDLMKLAQNVEMIEKATFTCDSSNIPT